MKKSIFAILILLSFTYGQEMKTIINVSKVSWQTINKEAIAKLILQQKKTQQKIKELEKMMGIIKPGKYAIKTFGAKSRTSPNFGAKIAKYYQKADIVKVTKYVDNFCKIGKNEWISKYVLKKVKNTKEKK